MCHKEDVRRLRDFAGIVAMLSDQEIDEMQAAIDARREARMAPPPVSRREGPPTLPRQGARLDAPRRA